MSKLQSSLKNDRQFIADIKGEIELDGHHRCVNCNKLLGIHNFLLPSFDVKCSRCGVLNPIFKKIDRQVFITDKDGTILYINKQVEKVTGYSAKEVLGQRPSLWGKQMKPEFYRKMWEEIAVKKKAIAVEIVNRNKSGQLYPVAVRISPLLDESGDIEFFIGIETVIPDGEKASKLKKSPVINNIDKRNPKSEKI